MWAGRVVRMGELKTEHNMLVVNTRGKRPLRKT
jgi:hypothetical protein